MAGGGGAWKVAYADFVTAMMAFFLVMWLVGQSDKVKEAIAQEFTQPASGRTPPRRPSRERKANMPPPMPDKKPVGTAAEQPSANKQRAASSRRFNPMQTATLIFFAENSDELNEEGQERLRRLVPWIAGKAQKIEVRGHSSRRPLPADSPFEDTWELCYARCLATIKFLEKQGIPPERVRISQSAGYEPYSARIEPQWQAKNSRVEIVMLNELVTDFDTGRDQQTDPLSESQ